MSAQNCLLDGHHREKIFQRAISLLASVSIHGPRIRPKMDQAYFYFTSMRNHDDYCSVWCYLYYLSKITEQSLWNHKTSSLFIDRPCTEPSTLVLTEQYVHTAKQDAIQETDNTAVLWPSKDNNCSHSLWKVTAHRGSLMVSRELGHYSIADTVTILRRQISGALLSSV